MRTKWDALLRILLVSTVVEPINGLVPSIHRVPRRLKRIGLTGPSCRAPCAILGSTSNGGNHGMKDDSRKARVELERGLELAARGDFEGGAEALETAVALCPNNWATHFQLGKLMYLGRHKDTEGTLVGENALDDGYGRAGGEEKEEQEEEEERSSVYLIDAKAAAAYTAEASGNDGKTDNSCMSNRAKAERAFLTSMKLRPERVVVDASLVPGPAVNAAFAPFEHSITRGREKAMKVGPSPPSERNLRSTMLCAERGSDCVEGKNILDEPKEKATGHKKLTLAKAAKDVQTIRSSLIRCGFHARGVRTWFGMSPRPFFGVGTMMVKRLAGDFTDASLGLVQGLSPLFAPEVSNSDEKHDYSDSRADKREIPKGLALEVLIRLFTLGLPVEEDTVTRALGPETVAALLRLGMLGLLPDIAAQAFISSSLSSSPSHPTHTAVFIGLVAVTPLEVPIPDPERLARDQDDAVVPAANKEAKKGKKIKSKDLWIATDWPPPVPVSLVEEPVMYLGPDSIALLRHLPCPPSADTPSMPNRWLDLCCGSGVQGIAAAATRGRGNLGKSRSRQSDERYSAEQATAEATAANSSHPARTTTLVDFVDVNPRALRFAAFNSRLNRVHSKVGGFFLGDLYGALPETRYPVRSLTKKEMNKNNKKSGKNNNNNNNNDDDDDDDDDVLSNKRRSEGGYDVILANPPFVPVPPGLNDQIRRYDEFSADPSGAGDGILRRILRDAPNFLRRLDSESASGTFDQTHHNIERHPELEEFIRCELEQWAKAAAGTATYTAKNSISNVEAKVIIMRGISGSGKSTVVQHLRNCLNKHSEPERSSLAKFHFIVCSADAYFENKATGCYNFDREALPKAHAWCFRRFKDAIEEREHDSSDDVPKRIVVVVDNTNTKRWEYEKYVKAAKASSLVTAVHILEMRVDVPQDGSAAIDCEEERTSLSDPRHVEAALEACAERNLHAVPLEKILAMHTRFEEDSRAVVIPAGGLLPQQGGSEDHIDYPGAGMVAIVTELPNPADYAENVLVSEVESLEDKKDECGSAESGICNWRAAIVYDSPPSTAKSYAARRSGSSGAGGDNKQSREIEAWAEHLHKRSIETIANALIFLRCTPRLSSKNLSSTQAVGKPSSSSQTLVEADVPISGTTTSRENTTLWTVPVRRAWSCTDSNSNNDVAKAARWVWWDNGN